MQLLYISGFLGLSLVLLAYLLRAKKRIDNETARKLVHFAHALVVAGWPAFIGYWFVIVGEIIFLGVVVVDREYKLFHQLKEINRKSWGEFFFPLGVIGLALIAPPTWVFVISLLLLGLADGAAAIIGQHIQSLSYNVFGYKKSLAGSLAFFGVALTIILAVLTAVPTGIDAHHFLLAVLIVPLITTIVENISPYGSDNLTVPLAVYISLLGLGVIT